MKKTGELLLKKFEDNAKKTMTKCLRHIKEKPDDQEGRKRYFKARAIYTSVAVKTGPDSPSKKAEKIIIEKAINNKKKTDIAI